MEERRNRKIEWEEDHLRTTVGDVVLLKDILKKNGNNEV
jgi:hypothetical protein